MTPAKRRKLDGCGICGRESCAHKDKQRDYTMRMKYGITLADFDALLLAQGGRCAICRTDTPGGAGGFHVDHDHACCDGKKTCGSCIRGLLCSPCNTALGFMRDDPERLRAAADYLDRASASAVA